MEEKVFSIKEVEKIKAEVRRAVVEEIRKVGSIWTDKYRNTLSYELTGAELDAIEGGEK